MPQQQTHAIPPAKMPRPQTIDPQTLPDLLLDSNVPQVDVPKIMGVWSLERLSRELIAYNPKLSAQGVVLVIRMSLDVGHWLPLRQIARDCGQRPASMRVSCEPWSFLVSAGLVETMTITRADGRMEAQARLLANTIDLVPIDSNDGISMQRIYGHLQCVLASHRACTPLAALMLSAVYVRGMRDLRKILLFIKLDGIRTSLHRIARRLNETGCIEMITFENNRRLGNTLYPIAVQE